MCVYLFYFKPIGQIVNMVKVIVSSKTRAAYSNQAELFRNMFAFKWWLMQVWLWVCYCVCFQHGVSFLPLRSCRCDLLGRLPKRWKAIERKLWARERKPEMKRWLWNKEVHHKSLINWACVCDSHADIIYNMQKYSTLCIHEKDNEKTQEKGRNDRWEQWNVTELQGWEEEEDGKQSEGGSRESWRCKWEKVRETDGERGKKKKKSIDRLRECWLMIRDCTAVFTSSALSVSQILSLSLFLWIWSHCGTLLLSTVHLRKNFEVTLWLLHTIQVVYLKWLKLFCHQYSDPFVIQKTKKKHLAQLAENKPWFGVSLIRFFFFFLIFFLKHVPCPCDQ